MPIKTIVYAFIALAISAGSAQAREGVKFGWIPSVGLLTVDDPDGSTDTQGSFDPLAAVIAIPLDRSSRILAAAGQIKFELDGSTSNIGQDVESRFVSAYYQRRWRVSRGFKPWIGGGPFLGFDEFTTRFTVDSDGFLNRRLSDRDETSIGLGVAFGHEWEMTERWDVGFTAEYLVSFGDALEGARIALTVFYK